ncbi:MAG: acyl-CoA dehydrogenase [SAR324 cluster bacterium]|nr:acyl-CoA dehydrogenase [SAR324 cluster bacterium]
MILFNPKNEKFSHLDEESRQIMFKTIDFFENKGKQKVIDDYNDKVWYEDFLTFLKENQVFATLLTPAGYGGEGARWDTRRICDFNEILGFYGLCYWYTWQVTILGLGPIWMSDNEGVKQKTAQLLKEGAIFAFGLSEKQHGADIYASDMSLITIDEGKYVAEGGKYYIGNANKAALVSVFGKNSETDEYVFFVVDSQHPNFDCVKNTVSSQNYVAEFALNSYPITENEIIHKGRDAWDASLNTINVGKYNLGWASIGICGHAFYEALNHASSRRLFDSFVTDFPHIKQLFCDAYCRLTAMKLFALRASDYMRSASREDRRYLLYNPMVKMKVTTQGEEVINHLWDVIAAKGFEKDQYFSVAAVDIRALPKLEGTVHVNMALIIKFMPNYFFNPGQFAEVPEISDAANDDFLFQQGPTKGLGRIQFHDFNLAYDSIHLPNLTVFKEQIEIFKEFMTKATPDGAQSKDVDFLLIVGELFTLVAYGQLIIENAKIKSLDEDILDRIFDVIIRDFSKFALQLYSKANSTETQMEICLRMIKKPVVDPDKFERVWEKYIIAKKNVYEMNP